MADTPLVAVRGLRKRYGGVVAVDGMNLAVRSGAIHAVVGENGAGKSTLMKVLAGVVRPDAGEIEIDGRPAKIVSPVVARQHGVGIVYQELSLFPQRSVLANLFVNREPLRRGFVSVRAMEDLSRDLLDWLGLRVDVRTPVSRLSIGEQQLVELARVLLEEPRLLILRRAELRAHRARNQAALRCVAAAERPRYHNVVRVAPARGGLRHLRLGHGGSQRP